MNLNTFQLGTFQLGTQEIIKDILARNRVSANFEIEGGSPEYGLKITIGKYVCWIFPDGADIIGADIDKRFEIYDFASLEALQAAYLEFFEGMLERFKT